MASNAAANSRPVDDSFDADEANYDCQLFDKQGKMGETSLMTHKVSGLKIVRKQVTFEKKATTRKELLTGKLAQDEPEIMKRVKNCQQIVQIIYSFQTPLADGKLRVTTFMEFCENKDLGAYLDSCHQNFEPIPEVKIHRWAKDLIEAVFYLHSQSPAIIHRDIKCDNIFLHNNYEDIKLGDFGLARSIRHIDDKASTYCGTMKYMSPECRAEQNTSAGSDCWALGMAVLEMAISRFQDISPEKQVVEIPSWYSTSLKEFIKGLLAADSDNRPSAKDSKTHPFIVIAPTFQEIDATDAIFWCLEHLETILVFEGKLNDPNWRSKLSGLLSNDPKRENLLLRAIRCNKTALALNLLACRPLLFDLNAYNNMGDAAIHLAAARGNTEVILKLAEAGADINLFGAGGDNFDYLMKRNGEEARARRLQEDYQVKRSVQSSASVIACQYGFYDTFVKLLEHPTADLNTRTHPNGAALVHVAAWCDRVDCLEYLIQRGVVVDQAGTTYGRTALHQACSSDALKTAQFLISRGANPNAKERKRPCRTPLHLAAIFSSQSMMELLLNNGAEINELDSQGQNALTAATLKKRANEAEFLKSCGANFSNCEPYLYEFRRRDSQRCEQWLFVRVQPDKLTQLDKVKRVKGLDFSAYGELVSFGPCPGPGDQVRKSVRKRYGFDEDDE